MPKLIALAGNKGSGKTTLAAYLTVERGFLRRPFAGPLKAMVTTLLRHQSIDPGEIERMINGDLKELPTSALGGRSPRYAMQTLGTEWRDIMSTTLWVDIWRNATDTIREVHNIVIDDLRFPHEAEAIWKLGGKIVLVDRPYTPTDEHKSENSFQTLSFDFVVKNNSTKRDAVDQLATYIDTLT